MDTVEINGDTKVVVSINNAKSVHFNDKLIWERSDVVMPRTVEISTWEELRTAVNSAQPTEKLEIQVIVSEIIATTAIVMPVGTDITVTSANPNAVSQLTQRTNHNRHFTVNGVLRLKDIVLTGIFPDNTINHGGVAVNSSARFYMETGSVITRCRNITTPQGGAVTVSGYGAAFVLNGGEVHTNSSFTPSSNAGFASIMVHNGARFTMNSGKIYNNMGRFGGGITIQSTTAFTIEDTKVAINGGEIYDNEALFGSGINCERGTVEMNGGVIRDNLATALGNPPATAIQANRGGGGIFLQNGGRLFMRDGEITGKESHNHGGGVMMLGGTMVEITGGNVTDNTAENNGSDVFVTAGATFNNNGGNVGNVFP